MENRSRPASARCDVHDPFGPCCCPFGHVVAVVVAVVVVGLEELHAN
jgi:hypothetical protein